MSSIDETLFNQFIIPTVVYFCNIVFFQLKIVALIWEAHMDYDSDLSTFEGVNLIRRNLVKLYVFLYILVAIVYMFIENIFYMHYLILILVIGTFVPQILYNLIKHRRKKVSLFTVFSIAINKLYIPVILSKLDLLQALSL